MSGPKTCHYYLQGNCKFGASCRFSHSESGGHGDYYDDYESKNYRNAGQQSYVGTNRNYKYGEREDYRNTNRYEKNNYKYEHDGKSNKQYEQNEYQYGNYSNRNNQYEQNTNYNYNGQSKSPFVKNNYNKTNYYEDENYEEETDSYNSNYNTYYKDNSHKNHYHSQKNYSVNNSKESSGKSNYNSQHNNKHFMSKNDGYDDQPEYETNVESYKQDNKNKTSSNRYKKYSNDHNDSNNYSNNYKTERSNVGEHEKMKDLFKNEIKIYQMQMRQMLINNYWPFTCYNPIGQSPIVEPVGSLNLMEVSFEEIRCDYYSVKKICADPEMIHAQIYEELILKAKQQKNDIINLEDFVVDDLIATFKKWEEAKTNSKYRNVIPVDKNVYWDMSVKRLKTPKDCKTLLDSFCFTIPEEVSDSKDARSKDAGSKDSGSKDAGSKDAEPKDTGPKILMQTEVYGRMENGFDKDNFTDYIPIMPPPQKYCL